MRAPLEQQLGTDLSQVRVDDGPAASEAARKINARAFTLGKQIMFSQDAFQPDTLKGLELLAHELESVPGSKLTVVFKKTTTLTEPLKLKLKALVRDQRAELAFI